MTHQRCAYSIRQGFQLPPLAFGVQSSQRPCQLIGNCLLRHVSQVARWKWRNTDVLSLPSTPIGILSEVKVQIPRASPIPGRYSVWFRRENWANMVDGPRHERLEDILLQEELQTWHFGPWKCRGQAKPCETNAEDGLWHGYFWTALWISTMVMLGICRFGSFICNFSAHVTPWWCTKYLSQIFKKKTIGDGTAQLLGINFKPVDWIKHLQKGNVWKKMTGERLQRSAITNHRLASL